MMMILGGIAVFLAAIPAILIVVNLCLYLRAPKAVPGPTPAISVLIPARNEAKVIGATIEAVLASRSVVIEVIVLDDHSEDRTAAILWTLADRDRRVRVVTGGKLPPGWCGKQYACYQLAQAAKMPYLCFLDADVRLAPDGLAELAAFQVATGADLVSGFPRQETGSPLEWVLIPLIHFILLGFLPMGMMRRFRHPSFAAGCGQLFLTTREAYKQMGGHAVIRASLHDGIKLPRAYRKAGKRTDLCDATDLATCRMYQSAPEVWSGLAKNATEGLATFGMILPATIVLLGGQVLPVAMLAAYSRLSENEIRLAIAGTALAYGARVLLALRFGQSPIGVLLHPLGVVLLVLIQWYALICKLVGKEATWKDRSYPMTGG